MAKSVKSTEAARRLGCSRSTVERMVRDGELTDVSGVTGRRHHARIAIAEIAAFKSSHVRKGRLFVPVTAEPPANAPALPKQEAERPAAHEPIRPAVVGRLERIEKKLDLLIGMWS